VIIKYEARQQASACWFKRTLEAVARCENSLNAETLLADELVNCSIIIKSHGTRRACFACLNVDQRLVTSAIIQSISRKLASVWCGEEQLGVPFVAGR